MHSKNLPCRLHSLRHHPLITSRDSKNLYEDTQEEICFNQNPNYPQEFLMLIILPLQLRNFRRECQTVFVITASQILSDSLWWIRDAITVANFLLTLNFYLEPFCAQSNHRTILQYFGSKYKAFLSSLFNNPLIQRWYNPNITPKWRRLVRIAGDRQYFPKKVLKFETTTLHIVRLQRTQQCSSWNERTILRTEKLRRKKNYVKTG